MSTTAGDPYMHNMGMVDPDWQRKQYHEMEWHNAMEEKKLQALKVQAEMEMLKAQMHAEAHKDGRDDYIDKLKFIIEAQAATIRSQETALTALGELVKGLRSDNGELRGVMHL